MRYQCGNCGSMAPGPEGCPRCDGPVFDLDTPVGAHDMREYRAMCRDREEGQVWPWLPLIPLAIMPVLLMMLAAHLGYDPFGRLPWWAERLRWAAGVGAVIVACVVLRRRRPAAVRALDDRLAASARASQRPTPASRRASSAAR
ncbi:MAG: hypothetical protein HY906_16955 [Deltaproteobacteria bacterium]|nr:hypothetical protein [Deltaproteobacteria bacterium]